MATPDFVLSLRERIGTEMLWLTGVTAVVLRGSGDAQEVLLVERADTGAWTPVTGIIDPGEEPAVAGAREVLEEAGVVAVAERLVWVQVLPPNRYPNGDRSQFLDHVFRFRWVSGDPWPADCENTQAAWFPTSSLPTVSPNMAERIATAVRNDPETRFQA